MNEMTEGNLIRVQKSARSKNKEGPKSTVKHNIAGFQVHLTAATPNEVPNRYPTSEPSECPPTKSYVPYLQSYSSAISTAQYAGARSDFYFSPSQTCTKLRGCLGWHVCEFWVPTNHGCTNMVERTSHPMSETVKKKIAAGFCKPLFVIHITKQSHSYKQWLDIQHATPNSPSAPPWE